MSYPEKELVDRSKRGDIEAFEELILAYEKKIYNIAYRMTNNREDASDIAQEVCIKIYKSINSFKENSTFSTWVYRIATNVCIDELRKRKNVVSLIASNENDEEFEIPLTSKERLPEEIVEEKETLGTIKRYIMELSPEYRMMIVLRDIRGHSYEEISQVLDINIGTVKSRLNRARNMLKEKLKDKEPFIRKSV
ncbi:ECF RNA polymerase sigma factor SigW [Oxobacter pfennigii]|uniref:ECF RNA polymerase sigma factor SigW n=1 Tax=Oxobacter pfennigii TaxID=36849 RepID=A0A0P8W480_9CLOT|nr:sigma-70 family RNA polymerase sigma factor [Oxobacter pfennigii]KPU42258.1 ECF RNA polymerase sigma factor SigW [Oxobacter pfennigii]